MLMFLLYNVLVLEIRFLGGTCQEYRDVQAATAWTGVPLERTG